MEEPNSKKKKTRPIDLVIDKVLPFLTDPEDRASASMVCKIWNNADRETREQVTISLCYAASPDRLNRRFPYLEHLKVKGKPRAAKDGKMIPEDWGGYATPWVNEIAISKFRSLKSVHFRRMIVTDLDLDVLAKARLDNLEALKLDWCSGFSTDGLLSIAKHCRKIETLLIYRSTFLEKDGHWLRELALHNTSLKVLNFYLTVLDQINLKDLETLATNCRSLVSVKMGGFEILRLAGFFSAATNLEEFFGGSFVEVFGLPNKYKDMSFPQKLCCFGFSGMGWREIPMFFPFAAKIRKLDMVHTDLDGDDQCTLIERCPNLEILETRNVMGDTELEILAQNCKKLKRLRIGPGANEWDQGITHRGLIYLAQGCQELEYIAVYVKDINNESLQHIGNNLKNLCDFRLVLLDHKNIIKDLPLDHGVRALLSGCKKLRRFALCLREGGLTNVGLGYIGQYSKNVRWMLLGNVGDSDEGLIALSEGCPKLQKLEMGGCRFSERAIATAVMNLSSLKYLWVQGYKETRQGDLSLMTRDYWNIERIPSRIISEVNELDELVDTEYPSQLLAYYSLDGKRTDYPKTVVPLGRRVNF